MEDLSAISAFVRVAEARSFAAAAAQLGMTPSGVSRAIGRLEERLGVRLLFRTTRSMRLTEDGAAFHARCKEILADLAEATEALDYSRRKPQGKLRVGLPTSLGRAAVIPNLADFEQRYPDIRLDLVMSDHMLDLNEAGIDCAIRMGELEDSSLIARRIGCLNNMVFASPDYLARRGEPTSLEDLREHRCINYVMPNGRPRQWSFETPRGRVDLDIDAHMLINDGESMIQAAMAGLGLIQIPHVMAACALDLGRLKPVMTDTVSTGKAVWIVYPQKKHLSARVHAFMEWTQALFGRTSQPAWMPVPAAYADVQRMPNNKVVAIAANS